MPRHSGPGASCEHDVTVPVVLPEVLAVVDDTGQVRIAVENIDHASIDPPIGPVDRRRLGAVLASIAEQVGGPVRVEVREADGSRYADILQPHTPEPGEDDKRAPIAAEDGPVLRGEGFLPGEPVLVAVVATSIAADADGTVRLPVYPRAPRRVDELILFGTGSGTIVRGTAPARSVRSRQRRWRR
jgi:hypothetical protein